eukprot:9327167-Pyramimonas_sp.AAC.1
MQAPGCSAASDAPAQELRRPERVQAGGARHQAMAQAWAQAHQAPRGHTEVEAGGSPRRSSARLAHGLDPEGPAALQEIPPAKAPGGSLALEG